MPADAHFAWDVPWQGLKSLRENSKRAFGTLEAVEKFGTGQERQGLKPDFFQPIMARLKSLRKKACFSLGLEFSLVCFRLLGDFGPFLLVFRVSAPPFWRGSDTRRR
jgi:hypothetical protein